MSTEVCSECNIALQVGFKSLGLDGCIEIIWCPKCGQQRSGEILSEVMEVEESNWAILVEWAGDQPSIKEISTVRMLDPHLQGKSLEEVVRLLRRSKDWRISDLVRYQANKILEQLQVRGIKADWWKGFDG
jgi:hypothetical protein